MAVKKMIPMIREGQMLNAVRVYAGWRYSRDPGEDPAYIKLYGINNKGETTIDTMYLHAANNGGSFIPNEGVASIFSCLTNGDYVAASFEFFPNDTNCILHFTTISSSISDIPDSGDSVTVIN